MTALHTADATAHSGRAVLGEPPALGLAAALGAAVVLFWEIGRPAVWTDEAATAHAVRGSWLGLLHLLAGRDAPLVPYYVIEKAYYDRVAMMTSADPWVVCRWSSAVFGAACVGLLVWWIAHHSRSVAVLAAALLVAFAGFDRYGQEARPYALMTLVTTWCWYSWWRTMYDAPARGRDRGYSASILALSLVNVFTLAQVLAQAVLTAHAARRGHAAAQRTAAALARGALWAAPWVVWAAIFGTGPARTLLPLTLDQLGLSAAGMLSGPRVADATALVVLGLGVVAVASARRTELRVITAVAAAWAIACPVVLSTASPLVRVALQPRYWQSSVPGCALLAALGVEHLAVWAGARVSARPALVRRLLRGVLSIALVGTIVSTEMAGQQDIRRPDGHGENARPAVAVVSAPRWRTAPILFPGGSSALVIAELDPALQSRIAGWDRSTGRFVSETAWPEGRLVMLLRRQPRAVLLVRRTSVDRRRRGRAYLSRVLVTSLPAAARRAGLTRGRVLYQGGAWIVYLLRSFKLSH